MRFFYGLGGNGAKLTHCFCVFIGPTKLEMKEGKGLFKDVLFGRQKLNQV